LWKDTTFGRLAHHTHSHTNPSETDLLARNSIMTFPPLNALLPHRFDNVARAAGKCS
jgi:hypothetical protein